MEITDRGAILTYFITIMLLFAQPSSASDGFYTIQTVTYKNHPRAVTQLALIKEKTIGHDLPYLRVIEFHNLFALRVGHFSQRSDAERHLPVLRPLYPDAFILFVKSEKTLDILNDRAALAPLTSHNKAKEFIGREEYGKAIDLLSPFVSEPVLQPEIVSDYLVLLIWEGRGSEAIGLYESLSPAFPRRPYLLENMGRAYYDEGRFEEALQLYSAAFDKDSSSIEAEKGIIYSSIMTDDWPPAYKRLEGLLTALPDPVPVAAEAMTLLHSKGLATEMVELYRAIDRRHDGGDEQESEPRNSLLAALSIETRDALHSAIVADGKTNGTELIAHYILTLIFGGEYERAVSTIDESGLNPASLTNKTTPWIAWAYFKTGRIEQAKELYREILTTHPGYLPAERGLAYCLAVDGDDRGAMEILDRLSKSGQEKVELHFARAFAHEQAGRYWNAAGEYDRIIALSPDNRVAQISRLQAMSHLGMTTGAIEIANRDLPDERALHDTLKGDQAIDYLHWEETGKALTILTPLLEDDANIRARFDHIALLIERGEGERGVELYEELIDEGISPPTWLLGSVAGEYLALGKPDIALELYERVLEEEPGSFDNRMGKFHALQALHEWSRAEELLDAIDGGEPEVYRVDGVVKPNWNKLEVAMSRGWFLVDQGRMAEGEKHFTQLRNRAPANSEIRSALAHTWLWRGWPRKALREFSIAESRDPENIDILTGKLGALNEVGFKRAAREEAAALLAKQPENRAVQELVHQFEVEEMDEINFAFSFTREEDGTKESAAKTTVYHPISLQTRLYAFLLWHRNWNDELNSYWRRAGLGAEHHINTSWRVEQNFSVNYDDGGDLGSFSLVDYHPDDYWRFELSYDSFSTDVPTRARIFNIDASKTAFEATYRESDWRSYTLALSTMSFSDDNRRDAMLARYEQGLLAKGDWRMRAMLDLYTSRSSSNTAPYFNPESDFSLSVTHMTEHILRRSRNSSHLHRLYTTVGIYNQSGFSSNIIGSLQYEHEYELSEYHSLLLGGAIARNVYDGGKVNSYTLFLNYTGRF